MRHIISIVVITMLITGLLPHGIASENETAKMEVEKYRGHVVCLDVPGSNRDARLFLNIEEFSSDEEMAELAKILKEQGQDKLLSHMWDMKSKGYVKIGTSLGYQIAIFRKIKTENGYIIRAITDRPIQMVENMRGLRTREFPIGIIELNIGPDGKGEGSLIAAAKVFFKDDKLKVELYGTRPCQVMRASKDEPKKKKKK